jgi:uncharacterized protein
MNEARGKGDEPLTPEERCQLLKLAREALYAAVCEGGLPGIDLSCLPPRLQLPGTSFVTLKLLGELRGCVGGLEARQPLALDVREHAAAAALHDHRFPHVCAAELADITLEISRLTTPQRLLYDCPEDLVTLLHPGRDGVVLRTRFQQATFLPQVWEQIKDPELFLSLLCEKMNAPHNLWRLSELQVYTYQVEKFTEGELS